MKILLGFSRGRGFAPISWAIEAVEKLPFSHAYLKIPSESLSRTLVYEATGKGVYFNSIDAFNDHSQPIEEYEIDITDDQKTKLLQFCIDNSGKEYGHWQIFVILCNRLANKIHVKLGDFIPNGNKQFICSELAAACLGILGYKVANDLDVVGIIELHNYVINIGKKVL